MGKPFQEYKDEWLERGHAGRNISEDHFMKVAGLLRSVLIDAGVENEDVKDIMIAVASKRPQIVNVERGWKASRQKRDLQLAKAF